MSDTENVVVVEDDDPYGKQYSLQELLQHHEVVNANVAAEVLEDEKAAAIEAYGLVDSVSKKKKGTTGGSTTEPLISNPPQPPQPPQSNPFAGNSES